MRLQSGHPDVLDCFNDHLAQRWHRDRVAQIYRVINDQAIHAPTNACRENTCREHRRIHASDALVALHIELRFTPASRSIRTHIGEDAMIIPIPLNVPLDGRRALSGIGVTITDNADALIPVLTKLEKSMADDELLCLAVTPRGHDDWPLPYFPAVPNVSVPLAMNGHLAHELARFVLQHRLDAAVNVRPCRPRPPLRLQSQQFPLLWPGQRAYQVGRPLPRW